MSLQLSIIITPNSVMNLTTHISPQNQKNERMPVLRNIEIFFCIVTLFPCQLMPFAHAPLFSGCYEFIGEENKRIYSKNRE